MARPALDYLILDAVADDVESLVHIRDGVADSARGRMVHETWASGAEGAA